MEEKLNTFLAAGPVRRLMRKYAAPCIIPLLAEAIAETAATVIDLRTFRQLKRMEIQTAEET